MEERVSIIEGEEPAIIVAPHGADEPHTGAVAEAIAEALECYAVINRGWERSDSVDWENDQANCNHIEHCLEHIVRQEFLDPIGNFVTQLEKHFYGIYVFYIHGVGFTGKTKPDVVIGYGAGDPARLTCDIWRKDALLWHLVDVGMDAYQGKPGGLYSAHDRRNMTQYFRRREHNDVVHSMQIEVSKEWREDEEDARDTGEILAKAIEKVIDLGDEGFTTNGFQIMEY